MQRKNKDSAIRATSPQGNLKGRGKIWLDGKFVDWDQAHIHVLSHALHYGSGAFEGIRCYKTDAGRALYRLDDHLDRLFFSAKTLDMAMPFSQTDLRNAIISLVQLNAIDECYIRPIVFYGYGNMSLDVSFPTPVTVAIALWPWEAYLGGNGVRVHISKYRRFHPQSVIIDAKITGYYASSVAATIEAKKVGDDEALLLDTEGNVAEGPAENIFMVKNGVLYTPAQGSILPGITRVSVIHIAKDATIEVQEKKITSEECINSDELFFTGTAVEICPIFSINGTRIGNGTPGPITQKIKDTYMTIVRGKNEKYKHWLSFI